MRVRFPLPAPMGIFEGEGNEPLEGDGFDPVTGNFLPAETSMKNGDKETPRIVKPTTSSTNKGFDPQPAAGDRLWKIDPQA